MNSLNKHIIIETLKKKGIKSYNLSEIATELNDNDVINVGERELIFVHKFFAKTSWAGSFNVKIFSNENTRTYTEKTSIDTGNGYKSELFTTFDSSVTVDMQDAPDECFIQYYKVTY